MPPKNMTEKAIAAELKKKNTAKAKEIVEKLKREKLKHDGGKSDSTGDTTEKEKKPSRKKTENVVSNTKKKSTVQPKEIGAKLKRTTQGERNSEVTMETNSASVEMDGGSSSVIVHPQVTDHVATSSKSQGTKSFELAASGSKTLKTTSSAAKNAKAGGSKGAAYQYEIDCKRVADAIDVIDLQRFIETHLKINGAKNNLDGTVSVCCEGQKVVIKSKAFFPKKSLRFLSKKFLKKNWNIRVVSKNVHSYEYLYVGTLQDQNN